MTDDIQNLIEAIAKTGELNPSHPPIHQIQPFQHYFLPDGFLDRSRLDERDGSCTRRELLLRFLLLNAVMDQGPDLIGVRDLLVRVTNQLYLKEVRFLHKPLSFFEELGIAIDQILSEHRTIKSLRARIWATENRSNPQRYNLFMDNTKQAMNYAVFRWGVPLALPLLLTHDCSEEDRKPTVLLDYLESWDSAEKMSQQLKDHERYGLGKAIGDKACHLFAKWMCSSFELSRRMDLSWGKFSFEVPYDSNAGRVLWRTGYLLKWASLNEYTRKGVIQYGVGKGGKHYIRVTNIRGMRTTRMLPPHIQELYSEIVINHLKTHSRSPRTIELQRIQHAYLLAIYGKSNLGVANFDDGLIHIGTSYCFNHDKPLCELCPVNLLCEGYQSDKRLIENFRT